MGTPRPTNEQVIQNVFDATLTLLKSQQLEEIRIVDIANLAEISRNSFYRNFDSKEDVLRRFVSRIAEEWYESLPDGLQPFPINTSYILSLLQYLYKYREITSILIRNKKVYLLKEEFDRRIPASSEETGHFWQLSFLFGGIFNVYLSWAEWGYLEPPEKLAETICRIISL